MYKVTDVHSQKKKYLVTITSGKTAKEYAVSEELFLEYRLVKGKTLDDDTFHKFKRAYEMDATYQKVLHYALFKPRCTHDIIAYFERLKVDEDDYKYHLHKLYKARILDDEAYAKMYVQDAFEFKHQGPRKIAYDLEKKRLKPSLYQPYLDAIKNADIEANIQDLYEKKVRGLKPQSVRQAIDKIRRFIVNKGYDLETVNRVLQKKYDEIKGHADEDKALEKDLATALRKYRDEGPKKNEKIYGYLLRKGYTYHKIKTMLGDVYHE